MLSSSDAKWKCLWYLLVWSIQLMLVSQFLNITDHIAFYIFAAISVLILPILTAVYSNTSGRHGSGLLRFGLVFCDPVLACLSVTPVLLLNKGPKLIDEYRCFQSEAAWNVTYHCIINKTDTMMDKKYLLRDPSPEEREGMLSDNRYKLLIIEMSVVIPIIVALCMGKRTRKMTITTYIFGFAYWFITAMESVGLMEIILLRNQFEHTIFTTETIICIAMIVTNSYAIVTLCSYINPVSLIDNKHSKHKFDFLYRMFLAVSGIFFAEIPLFIARCQIVADDLNVDLPGTFYIWFMKDILWLILIPVLVYVQRFGQKYLRIPCKPRMSKQHLYFLPEKRDAYINRYRDNVYKTPVADLVKKPCFELKKASSVPNIQNCDKTGTAYSVSSKSTTALDKIGKACPKNEKPCTKQLLPFTLKKYSPINNNNSRKLKKPNKKRVTFKLDLGMGKFLEMKPRSDSPPVFHMESENPCS